MIDPQKIALRDLVDRSKMPPREGFEQSLREKIRANTSPDGPRINAVIVTYDGQPIGFHTVNPVVPGEYGIFHAHLIDPSFRGRGVGGHSYRLATKLFFDRFSLQKILFKRPAINLGPNRVKEKLGIRYTGEEVAQGLNILQDGLTVRSYELTREEADRL